jgi:hypothetical protein
VFKLSHKKYIFDCNICNNEFESSLAHISNNRWCPHCKHKTELKLFEWLKKQNYNIRKQLSFHWSQNKVYDFIIE